VTLIENVARALARHELRQADVLPAELEGAVDRHWPAHIATARASITAQLRWFADACSEEPT
jgi:hypothetical protein